MASLFTRHLEKRVLVCDGAMGTMIHKCTCDLHKDYLDKENCCEVLNLTRPDVIQGIHEAYLAAGADIVETNTFSGSGLVLAEFDLAERTTEIAQRAAEIARAACERHSTSDRPRFVLGSLGPGTKLLTLGHTTWDEMFEAYVALARGLIDGGADALITETSQDILQAKCAVNACLKALAERRKTVDDVPILCSVTIETTGTMLLGTEIAAAAEALANFPILSLGLNCATGPVEMTEHVAWLGRHWPRKISVMPNAGLPVLLNGKPDYALKPRPFVEHMLRFVEHDGVNIVGGCCGTTPDHIAALAEALGTRPPKRRSIAVPRPGCSSLYSAVEFRQDNSFLIVGERTNTNGSRQFKNLLAKEDWDGLVSMGKELLRDGSHVLDVCVDYVGRDGVRDMREVIHRFARQVAAPLMIDSTQVDVIEEGLKHAPGKCIINSMNLEEGEEKLARICALARTYGAAVVAGTIDEDPVEAMGKTADRKIAIARRIHDLAVRTHGLRAHDILFDPLVLPITTGVEADRRLALETIEGIRRIAGELPECGTMIGLSNVSFGLKASARVVLNSVFLHECLAAGLTGAIVHFSKILPRKDIEDARWNAALDLIYDKRRAPGANGADDPGFDPLTAFVALFPDDESSPTAGRRKQSIADLPLEERLQRHIIDGEVRGLVESLDAARENYKPLDIINDHLLAGMKVVGELFGSGEMQLPFVLQSAETMKKAVAHLEPFMDKAEGQRKALMVLATVQGDVHDIGKNLVDIILSNNGYEVVNLGIKQPLNSILQAAEEHRADAIGLSGLLVKSVGVMKDNLEEMALKGLHVPVILGGAALTRQYAEEDLRDIYSKTFYGRDAFEGLRFMDHVAAGTLQTVDREIAERTSKRAEAEAKYEGIAVSSDKNRRFEARARGGPAFRAGTAAARSADADTPRSAVPPCKYIPTPPFWGSRVVEGVSLDQVYPFVNRVALYRGQWQFKKGAMSDEEFAEQTRGECADIFSRLAERCTRDGILRPRVVYGYFPCNSEGDDLVIFDPRDPAGGREIERFTFPRQDGRQNLCISDFFRPLNGGAGFQPARDVVALHCVTMGEEVSRRTRELFEKNEYKEYLYLHGFGVECAEALAEMWHKRVRQELGIGGEDSPRIRELFTQKYRGSRYSFGYPACPDMSDQEKLWRLLDPERIGCRLTENWQIDPEQSTSAVIVHHPGAKYFNV
jgi:5-methyltetrahydrofolate--homocysteine methyltransferase